MTQNSWVGRTLGERYQIEELLGQGGMSAVYKATDPNLRRVVAVKMIHPHLSDNQEFVRRFEEEAAAVAQLRHPNIIQVYDFNNDSGVYYMVLEFVAGETLHDRLKRLNSVGRRLPFAEAAGYAIDICEAVDYAHKRGMIHRDIKPANVMLDIHSKGILMDFGIAKIVGGQQHTATGAVIGTALYMAPEQIRGEKIDERVDVYSIGVTLFEMLTGRPPYEADSAMTLMMMHLNDPIPDLRQLQPDVPDGLAAVVEKALAKDRSQRYLSAVEMAADLRRVQKSLPGQPPASATTLKAGGPQLETTPAQAPAEAPAAMSATVRAAATEAAVGETPPGALPQAAPSPAVPGRRKMSLWAGGAALLVLLLCVVVGGALAFSQFSGAGEGNASATQTAAALALLAEPTDEPTATSGPTATFTAAPPADTPTPESSPTPALSPTPTIPPGIPFARINAVTMDGEGNYVVEYELFEFSEQLKLDGYHLTFFFDNVPPEQVGSPYETLYYMYAGESPFTKLTLELRSDTAQQICVLVTNPNHTVEQGSGNCFPLPETDASAGLLLNNAGVVGTPTASYPPAQPTKEKEEKDSNY
ncbi:MAG: serine/threonine protein kinase [Anaerolineales bacterium]|nr:serine/threonine protein kinase [Anaerolineales bacterium]